MKKIGDFLKKMRNPFKISMLERMTRRRRGLWALQGALDASESGFRRQANQSWTGRPEPSTPTSRLVTGNAVGRARRLVAASTIGARGPGGVSADPGVAPDSESPAGGHADAAPCPGQDAMGTGEIERLSVRPVVSIHTSRKGGMVAEEGLEPPTRGL